MVILFLDGTNFFQLKMYKIVYFDSFDGFNFALLVTKSKV